MAQRIADLAGRRHGIVERAQLVAEGCATTTIDRWLREGRLHLLFPGVYSIVPPALLTPDGRWLAGVLAAPKGSALSHQPAGQLLWILERGRRSAIHVSLPPGRRCRLPGLVAHRPRRLEPVDLTERSGIPVTTATRTVWDLAYVLSPRETGRAFHRAERNGGFDRRRLGALLAEAPNRRGAGTIRELLAMSSIPLDRVRSQLEEIILLLCRETGLETPVAGAPVLGYEVDFLWERARVVVEADGGEHLTPQQRMSDNARDARLLRAGYFVRRYTWWDTLDPLTLTAELAEIIRERTPA